MTVTRWIAEHRQGWARGSTMNAALIRACQFVRGNPDTLDVHVWKFRGHVISEQSPFGQLTVEDGEILRHITFKEVDADKLQDIGNDYDDLVIDIETACMESEREEENLDNE